MSRAEILAMPTIAYFEDISIKKIEYGIEDYILCTTGTFRNGGTVKAHRLKLYYRASRPYFKVNGRRIHIDECMRISTDYSMPPHELGCMEF